MKLHKQHRYYQADGADTGNTGGSDSVDADESSVNADEGNTDDASNVSPEFTPDMPLDEMEKGLEMLANDSSTDEGNTEGSEGDEDDNSDANSDADENNTDADDDEQNDNQDQDDEGNTDSQDNDDDDAQNEDVNDGEVDSVTISDEYIESRPEDERAILAKLKGKTTDPQILKNYIHGQKHIQTLTSKDEDNTRDEYVPPKPIQQQESNERPLHSFEAAELQSHKSKRITEIMKEKYPDFPDNALTDRTVLNEYYSEMDYDKKADYEDMKSHLGKITNDVDTEVNEEVEVGRNWKAHANHTIKKSFDAFEQFLESEGVTAKDLGVVLGPELAESILYDENKKANPRVVFKQKGIPIIVEDSFTDALKIKLFNKISTFKETRAREGAFTKRRDAEPGPSLSSSNNKGKSVQRKVLPKVMTPDMSLDGMEKILEKS